MVDFNKKIGTNPLRKKIIPYKIYDDLDRKTTKDDLRPIQKDILDSWHKNFRDKKDVILKLHTGQGKTLIGLLILQSKLNEQNGTALYLCPNNYLVDQTCEEAKNFGFNYVTAKSGESLPPDFNNGKAILITTVNKLFNGKSKFGIKSNSLNVSYIVMDDSHSSINVIRNSFKISLPKDHQIYVTFRSIFTEDLKKQGLGTFEDILNNINMAYLPVPYWAWEEKIDTVTKILSKHSDDEKIKFAWPIIKDILIQCQCIISSTHLEITPYNLPLNLFESFSEAKHRIFMSATIQNDSFFIRDLGLDIKTITTPLCIENEQWAGEKMILIPSLIHDSLDRNTIMNLLATNHTKYNTVVLTPSFNSSQDWENLGAKNANTDSIFKDIKNRKNNIESSALVIANRYDGIDLPDDSCRILIFDSKPYSRNLDEIYLEDTLRNSDIVNIKTTQKIEQGLGRAVRGKKDYCAYIILGADLIQYLKDHRTKKYFSAQTQKQIDIGNNITKFVEEDLAKNKTPEDIFSSLLFQCLNRDSGWKNYYKDTMDSIEHHDSEFKMLDYFSAHYNANEKFISADYNSATNILQNLLDKHPNMSNDEKGYYLQEMARYSYPDSIEDSIRYQISAHNSNRYLLKPIRGTNIIKLNKTDVKRLDNIKNYINNFGTIENLAININAILNKLAFGINSNSFERGIMELGEALGFISQRPEKEFKAGPDNLWKLNSNQYILIECKSEVQTTRSSINKKEAAQINTSLAWFKENYDSANVNGWLIISTEKLHREASLDSNIEIVNIEHLSKFYNSIDTFFKEFLTINLSSITTNKINQLLTTHKLDIKNILDNYSTRPIR